MNIGSTWLSVSGDTIADWSQAQVEGGHAFVLAGVRHKNGQRQFLVHNSWGADWGDKGGTRGSRRPWSASSSSTRTRSR